MYTPFPLHAHSTTILLHADSITCRFHYPRFQRSPLNEDFPAFLRSLLSQQMRLFYIPPKSTTTWLLLRHSRGLFTYTYPRRKGQSYCNNRPIQIVELCVPYGAGLPGVAFRHRIKRPRARGATTIGISKSYWRKPSKKRAGGRAS